MTLAHVWWNGSARSRATHLVMEASRSSFAAPSMTIPVVPRSGARSRRWGTRIVHRHWATVYNSQVRAARPTAVVGSEDNEACCSGWTVRMTAQPTYVADATRDIVVGSWYYYMTQQSGCIGKCLDSDAKSRSAPLVRPANRAPERPKFARSATEKGFATQSRNARWCMRTSWFATTDIDYYGRSSWSLPIRFATNWGRRRRWTCTIVGDANSEVDHQRTTDAASNAD